MSDGYDNSARGGRVFDAQPSQKGGDFISRVKGRMDNVFDGVEERLGRLQELVPHGFNEERISPADDALYWQNAVINHPDPPMAFERYVTEREAAGVPRAKAVTEAWQGVRGAIDHAKKKGLDAT